MSDWGALIPIGLVGVWRWSMWLAKRVPAAFYRPVENDFTCTATIVTAVFREDPRLFRRALETWIANAPERIIAVIDETDSACREVARQFPQVEVLPDPGPGKRPKVAAGVDAATTDLVVLADSDVIWKSDVLKKLKMPFADPRMGGVSARPYGYPTHGDKMTLWERLAEFYLEMRYSAEVPATTWCGQAVSCLSGRTTAYRTTLLHRMREPFLNETFAGVRCLSGDDKCYTMLVLRAGYKTWHQLNAKIYSTFRPDFRGFMQQRIRWGRNSFRSDWAALSQRWIWRHPYLAFVLIDKQLGLLTQLNSPVFLAWAIVRADWAMAALLVVWWHVSRSIKVGGLLVRQPRDLTLVPAFLAATFLTNVIRYYALFTVRRQEWLTRPSAIQDGQVIRLDTPLGKPAE